MGSTSVVLLAKLKPVCAGSLAEGLSSIASIVRDAAYEMLESGIKNRRKGEERLTGQISSTQKPTQSLIFLSSARTRLAAV